MKYYIKVITGFREDQETTIPMQEAHKAYYLFKHPEERGVFECGVALIGRNIQEIKPDWNATMGYKPTYELTGDDWTEIKNKGVEDLMKILIQKAKDVAELVTEKPELMKEKLEIAMNSLVENKQISNEVKTLSDKYKIS